MKPVLIVCRESLLANLYHDSPKDLTEHVAQILSMPYSATAMRQVIEAVKTHSITTILTRGIWYNRLLENDYFREHPTIQIKQIPIGVRSQVGCIDEIIQNRYRHVVFIMVNSPFIEKRNQSSISTTTFQNLKLTVLSINELDTAEEQITSLLRNLPDIDAFGGDAAEFSSYLRGYPIIEYQFHVASLSAMVRDALQYAQLLNQQNIRDVDQLFATMLHFISEGVLAIDPSGNIFATNDNYILNQISINPLTGQNITSIVPMTVDEIISMPANNVVLINGHHYLVNVFPTHIRCSLCYLLMLNSRARISTMDLSARTQIASSKFPANYTFSDILAVDPHMKSVIDIAKTYALFDETVLITGESGTGKELFASAIHQSSQRRPKPFVAINCATFNESLMDSELFGYEKGSFTGALNTGKRGLFEIAHQGTLFLDEISEIPLPLQARLLRVLQEKAIMRIGGKEVIPINVRIIAATNKDLLDLCNRGLFRYDLYYRLAVLELALPPLRERKQDIIPLFEFFIRKASQRITKKVSWNNYDIFKVLLDQDWGGNIRSLENVALRTVILAKNHIITREDILAALPQPHRSSFPVTAGPVPFTPPAVQSAPADDSEFHIGETDDLDRLEYEYLSYLLKKRGGDRSAVCDYLHISKATLWRKLNYSSRE